MQNLDLDEIEEERGTSYNEHEPTLDLRRAKEALCCLVEQPDSHNPDREDGAESSQNLCPMITECELVIGMSMGDFQGTD